MSKKNNSAGNKKNKKKIFGKLLAGIIAVALLAGSCYVVWYFVQRGYNSMQNYNSTQNATETTNPTDVELQHPTLQYEMPPLSSDNGNDGYLDGAVYIWNNKGFEIFKGTISDAKAYANSVSNYQKLLGDDYKLYSVVVPTSVEIALPERLSKTVSNNQKENISTIFSQLSMEVTPVDVYSVLGENRNKDLYYSTDKYWTQQGAYYAYTALAEKLGVQAVDISDFNAVTLEDSLLGSHISATISKETVNGNPMLVNNPDVVTYYSLADSVTVKALPQGGEELEELEYYNSDITSGDSPLDLYNTKDCAYTVLSNKDVETGQIAIITDKFGYSVAPFLTENFNKVHLIDIDNFQRNLTNYLEDNKISNVVYINGIMSANTAAKIEKMDAMY